MIRAAGCVLLLGVVAGTRAQEDPARACAGALAERDSPSALAVDFDAEQRRRILQLSPLPEPPLDPTNRVSGDPAAARLGQFLFFDRELSRDGEQSCADCHQPAGFLADGRRLGLGRDVVARHTPALWNVAYQRWFFWDGRADSLWAQALQPFEEPREHGTSRLAVVRRVLEDAELAAAYAAIFGEPPRLSEQAAALEHARPVAGEAGHPHQHAWDGLAPAERETIDRVYSNLGKAIAAYERLLVSRRAPFDLFVEGLRTDDEGLLSALSPSAQRGLQLFVSEQTHCRLCHSGPLFSDLEFHSTRIPPLDAAHANDLGRQGGIWLVRQDPFNGVGSFSDAPEGAAADKLDYLQTRLDFRGQFKTPTLRNVAVSPPYMHQGQIETLGEVVRHYSDLSVVFDPVHDHVEQFLVPLHLSDEQQADLVAFLESLTDVSLPAELLEAPGSPR